MRMLAAAVGVLLGLAVIGPVASSAEVSEPDAQSDGAGADVVDAAASATAAELTMPASAHDGTTVTAKVAWRRLAGEGVTGRVDLEVMRTGTSAWARLRSVEVTDGAGSATFTPRDDGTFRVRWSDSTGVAAGSSDAVPFDNVPVRDVRLRIAQYNLPGPDKLTRSTTRATRAGYEVRRLDPDVLVLNELVGPGRNSLTNRPSRFARSVLAALGSHWAILTPTMALNENYVAYRTDRLRVVAHYPDRVVPGTTPRSARHVTPVLLKDRTSNQPFLLVGTHLVSGDGRAARAQAYSVGSHSAALSHGYPVVVAGDMNTSAQLEGLTAVGLKDARRHASSHVNGQFSTFTSYARRTPSRSVLRRLDHIYVPRAWTVRRWTTALDTRSGRFVQPRATDHSLVSASVVGPRPSR